MIIRWVICTVFSVTVFCIPPGLIQAAALITPSGLNTHVNISATPPHGSVQYNITGGTRSGTNLFHSFGEFGVPNNNIANFLNDSGSATSNILGRVTGGNVSNIFGTIQTTGFGNANLFLMNPAGIVFGPTASLNVGGSVTFTTADYLRLDKIGGSNAGIFHANPAQTSLLTSAPVDAFGFLGASPAAITVQGGQLTVPEGQGISLIGGNITIQNGALENGTIQPAHLSTPNGQINLATAKSPGEFLQDLTAAPNINGTSFRSYGSAHFTSGSTVDFSQTGNGKISIRGGQLVLEVQTAVLDTTMHLSPSAVASNQDTILLAPGSSIVSRTFSADRGPDIQLVADRLQLIGDADPLSQTQTGVPVNVWARTNGSGDAGNIALRTTGDLQLINQVQIESTSGATLDGTEASPILAPGNAGHVELTSAHGNILMTGLSTWASSQTWNSSGKTGAVTASAPEGDITLDVAGVFSRVGSQSSGGGHVQITARNLLTKSGLLGIDNFSRFKPDGITVALSDNLTMSGSSLGGSLFVTSALSPITTAQAGDITLTAKNIVATQGSLISSETFSAGTGGQLKIFTDTLQLLDGSQIKSGSAFAPPLGKLPQGIIPTGPGGDITIQGLDSKSSVMIDGQGSGIFANTEGTGVGGSINLSAKTLTIQNGGIISASTTGTDSRAIGGSITVNATDQVALTNGGSITASSTGPANAGNIKIDAGKQLSVQDSKITTEAMTARGGNIEVIAKDRIQLANGRISTSVLDGSGDSGRISIDPNEVIVQNNSKIFAQAVRGNGGDITITTPRFLQDSTSLINASSQFGQSGRVSIQSSTSNLSGTVAQLASKPSEIQALLQSRCVALAGGEQSTFIVAGRDALPSEPGGWLSSPVSMEHWTGEDTEHASGPMVRRKELNGSPPMVAPQTETAVLSLRRLTPPGFLVRTFGIDRLTSCRS
ncbi:MAG: filamentous hemagglutinin N-terminal domain-containing protein [Nitrospira sp.]|nr:filamentous hemagglutinin N-terminal domain-containing protein [Nitrospira sp.]